MGSLRRRGKIWWIRYYRNGKRHEESAHTDKETIARNLLKSREGDVVKGIPVSPAIHRLRFDEAIVDVVNDYRINGKATVDEVERRIAKHLLPFFGGRRMTSITEADMRAYIAKRQADTELVIRAHERRRKDGTMRRVPEQRRAIARVSNAEINREIAIVRRAFRLAVRAGKLLHRPDFANLQERNVRIGFFEREEFEAVRDRLPNHLKPVATFAYLTGWRIYSEILSLEWRQVDLQAGTVRLDPGATKNSEGRSFPFGDVLPELRDVLEAQWRATKRLEQDRDAIIARVFHRNGKPIRNPRGAWKAACEAAGHPQRLFHDFRRTAVRNLVRAGVPERVAMQLTGHKTRSVFDRYDIVNEADLRSGIEKLGALAGTATGTIRPKGKVRRIRTAR